jgi:hypothetical protein
MHTPQEFAARVEQASPDDLAVALPAAAALPAPRHLLLPEGAMARVVAAAAAALGPADAPGALRVLRACATLHHSPAPALTAALAERVLGAAGDLQVGGVGGGVGGRQQLRRWPLEGLNPALLQRTLSPGEGLWGVVGLWGCGAVGLGVARWRD